MNTNTRVQLSEKLSSVPDLCVNLVENKIRRQLEIVSSEIEHLIKVSKHDSSPKPESIVWHIDQARQRLYWLDSYMQDVHTIASQYLGYIHSKTEEELGEKTESLRQSIDEITGGLEDEESSKSKDK